MTNVGKALVFVVTFFSVLFLGFAVTVFATRTNWMEKYNTTKKELADRVKEKGELEQIRQAMQEALEKSMLEHEEERGRFIEEVASLQERYAELLTQYVDERKRVVQLDQQVRLALLEVQARRDEVMKPDVGLRDQLARIRKERENAMKMQFESEQKQIELQSRLEIADEQNKSLLERTGQLSAILESHGLSAEPKDHLEAILANPPQVEGVVTAVDGKHVQISIGSDSGLRRRHRLDVYRLKPSERYLGKLELIEVDPDRSVGRVLPQFKNGTIREGDRVASRIIASR